MKRRVGLMMMAVLVPAVLLMAGCRGNKGAEGGAEGGKATGPVTITASAEASAVPYLDVYGSATTTDAAFFAVNDGTNSDNLTNLVVMAAGDDRGLGAAQTVYSSQFADEASVWVHDLMPLANGKLALVDEALDVAESALVIGDPAAGPDSFQTVEVEGLDASELGRPAAVGDVIYALVADVPEDEDAVTGENPLDWVDDAQLVAYDTVSGKLSQLATVADADSKLFAMDGALYWMSYREVAAESAEGTAGAASVESTAVVNVLNRWAIGGKAVEEIGEFTGGFASVIGAGDGRVVMLETIEPDQDESIVASEDELTEDELAASAGVAVQNFYVWDSADTVSGDIQAFDPAYENAPDWGDAQLRGGMMLYYAGIGSPDIYGEYESYSYAVYDFWNSQTWEVPVASAEGVALMPSTAYFADDTTLVTYSQEYSEVAGDTESSDELGLDVLDGSGGYVATGCYYTPFSLERAAGE
ncbi:MAG: hypothetical protein LBS17_02760 [Actinomycetes bacterium]|nr:hypothetical protein [Actinomycetes bacterium]